LSDRYCAVVQVIKGARKSQQEFEPGFCQAPCVKRIEGISWPLEL
jgi:hypothetical protein